MIEDKLTKFRKDIQQHSSIVFCTQCGSTIVDQNFPNQLKCYSCGNTLDTWDNKKFSIARGQGVKGSLKSELNDAEKLFKRIEEENKK